MSDLEKPAPDKSFFPNIFPAYFVARCDLMQTVKPKEHKTECYFYSEEQDMHARIPCCDYHKYYYEDFDCSGCQAYVAKETVSALVRSLVDNGEFNKEEK